MSIKKHSFVFLFLALALALTSNCKKADESTSSEGVQDEVSNIIDSAVSNANSQANSIVYTGMLLNYDELQAQDLVQPFSTCSISTARSSCSSNTVTVNWNSCTVGNSNFSATVTGVVTETYSGFGAGVCMMNGSNSILTRKVDDNNPRKLTFTAPTAISGATLISKMNPDTAYDGTTFPQASTGTTISRLESGTSNGQSCSSGAPCYNVISYGTQNTMTGPKGTKWFDHILTSDITATGSRSLGTLAMSGTTTVWHQVAQYKAVNAFSSITWGSSTCCYPTSGSITSTITGSVSGTATTTFSSTCGSATFVNTDGNSSTVTFKQCQP